MKVELLFEVLNSSTLVRTFNPGKGECFLFDNVSATVYYNFKQQKKAH